jgi:hypothetical protein
MRACVHPAIPSTLRHPRRHRPQRWSSFLRRWCKASMLTKRTTQQPSTLTCPTLSARLAHFGCTNHWVWCVVLVGQAALPTLPDAPNTSVEQEPKVALVGWPSKTGNGKCTQKKKELIQLENRNGLDLGVTNAREPRQRARKKKKQLDLPGTCHFYVATLMPRCTRRVPCPSPCHSLAPGWAARSLHPSTQAPPAPVSCVALSRSMFLDLSVLS